MKILLTFLIILDLVVLALLVIGVIAAINDGGGSVLFPGIGLVVALPLLLGALFVIEMILIGVSLVVYRYIKNRSANSF